MTNLDEADYATDADSENTKLEQALVEAHYLGLSLRALAANPDFRFAEITASISEPLIGWAKFIDDRLQSGERAFAPDRSPRPRAPGRKK